ncbi:MULTISPECIES: hypothetical protein [Pseudonocardia]|uniref:Uncharacterized protein n=2 Tax=Pseudonocardia TaxID=1847 RepID=A0A1Y2N9K2_PSEAH|nr:MULTISPECIES: hypothetical protein [Pseudonocardia]OSY44143.1 hypothetical protein BG845_00264 [Pseudonocardia autotrophica]TDN74127.1 hypothetical protein C8E95_3242 [Pseudonocardia autotrophica]BBG04885.1 hypothetical protein Pdca_60940 [Pseudonocardia autotrophica]GEC23541.1 hypothetical protein PSA01_05700 [Pseudonocardia saturnea]
MLDPSWVFLGAALGLAGSVRYAIATLTGTARPNLVTWTLWAGVPLIAFFAQISAGVGLPAVLTLGAGVGPLLVVVAALSTRHGLARIGVFDVVCGTVAVVALVVWLGFDEAPLAVLLAVAADAAAALPTIRKGWRDPGSENLLFYVLVGLGATLTLFTVTSWEPSAWAFAAYMLVLCVVMIAVVTLRR